MKKETIVCDMCGKDVGFAKVINPTEFISIIALNQPIDGYDLCEDCVPVYRRVKQNWQEKTHKAVKDYYEERQYVDIKPEDILEIINYGK